MVKSILSMNSVDDLIIGAKFYFIFT